MISANLLDKVANLRPSSQETIGLACSGGMDSMLLFRILQETQTPFHVLHFNHRWREDKSIHDADWLRTVCQDAQIPCTIGQARTTGPTSEGKARNARWSFLIKQAKKLKLHSIWTAHHGDDLTETFLLQLLRGAGPDGLAGLTEFKSREGITIIRPFLSFKRKELSKIASSKKIAWREDETNQSMDFFRNRIRHRLLPYMHEISGRDPSTLILRTAQLLAEENNYWESLLPKTFPKKIAVNALKDKHPAYQRRYLKGWLHAQSISAPSFDQIEAVRRLVYQRNPAKINLHKNRYCRRRTGYLFLE